MATRTWTGSGPRAERRGFWQAQVEAHRRSRQSQAAFCAQRGLRKGTFSFWKWKLKQGAGAGVQEAPATVTPPFIPVRMIPAPAAQRAVKPPPATRDGVEVELTLGLGRCLRVRGPVESMWLVQVLRGLEAPGC
jgi:hypothetical protein